MGRWIAIVLAASAVFGGTLPGVAQAAARPSIRASIATTAVAGDRVSISGRLTGHPAKGESVVLQQLTAHKWVSVRTVTARPAKRFSLRWRPVKAGSITVRVALLRGKHVLAAGHAVRVRVRVRPAPVDKAPSSSSPTTLAAPSPAPTPTPTSTPDASATTAPVLTPVASSVLSVPAPGQTGTVRLAGGQAAQPGDFLAVGVGPNTPYGFLGRVDAVTGENGDTVLATSPASLPEIMPKGSFDASFDAAQSKAASRSLRQAVDDGITCTDGEDVDVHGSVTLTPHFDVQADWSDGRLNSASLTGDVTASAQLSEHAGASVDCKLERTEIASFETRPFTFTVGPIPVVVVPKITVYLEGEGKVDAEIDSEIHGSFTATAGIGYSGGGFHPIGAFTHSLGYTQPVPQGNGDLTATVTPTAELLFYGVAGPELAFAAGLHLHLDTTQSPKWKLTAPISVTAQLVAPLFDLASPKLVVYSHEFQLAPADNRLGHWVGDLKIAGSSQYAYPYEYPGWGQALQQISSATVHIDQQGWADGRIGWNDPSYGQPNFAQVTQYAADTSETRRGMLPDGDFCTYHAHGHADAARVLPDTDYPDAAGVTVDQDGVLTFDPLRVGSNLTWVVDTPDCPVPGAFGTVGLDLPAFDGECNGEGYQIPHSLLQTHTDGTVTMRGTAGTRYVECSYAGPDETYSGGSTITLDLTWSPFPGGG